MTVVVQDDHPKLELGPPVSQRTSIGQANEAQCFLLYLFYTLLL